MMRLACALVLFGAASCYDTSKPLPPVYPDYPQESTVAVSLVCDHLRALDCPEGKGSPGGQSCEQTVVQERQRPPRLHEGCWLDAGTKEDIRKCGDLRCRD